MITKKIVIGVVSLIALLMLGVVFVPNKFRPNTKQTRITTSAVPTPSIEITQADIQPSSTPYPEVEEPTYTAPQKDTTPPLAYILSPKDGDWVERGMTVKIVANVTDNVKVDRVEFYAGSSDYMHLGTVREPPYEVTWTIDDRWHAVNIPLYLKAYDTSGNRAENIGQTIAVNLKN